MPAKGPEPLREIQLDSPQHQFVGVYPLPNDPDYLLAMQSRDPQARKLIDDEVEKAAKQFLPQDRLAAIEEASILEFDVISSLVEDEKKRKNVTADIRSLKDFEQYLPELYREMKESATQYKRGSMESELLNPIVGAFGLKPFSPQHTAWLEGDITATRN